MAPSDAPALVVPRTHSNCIFAAKIAGTIGVECRGAPPVPVVLGAHGANLQIVTMRPRMDGPDLACALWRARPGFEHAVQVEAPPLIDAAPASSLIGMRGNG